MKNALLRYLTSNVIKTGSRFHVIVLHVSTSFNLAVRACFTKCLEYKRTVNVPSQHPSVYSTEIWWVKHFTFTSVLLLMETWAGGVSACVSDRLAFSLFAGSPTQVKQVFADNKWGVSVDITAREQSAPLSWKPPICFTFWPPQLAWVTIQHQSLSLESGS